MLMLVLYVYMAAARLTVPSNPKEDSESSSFNYARRVQIVAGQVPTFLCFSVLCRRKWGSRFEFHRYLCIALAFMWVVDAIDAFAEKQAAVVTAVGVVRAMSTSMLSHLAIGAGFIKTDNGKEPVRITDNCAAMVVITCGVCYATHMLITTHHVNDTPLLVVVVACAAVVAVGACSVTARLGYGVQRGLFSTQAVPQWFHVVGSVSLVYTEYALLDRLLANAGDVVHEPNGASVVRAKCVRLIALVRLNHGNAEKLQRSCWSSETY
jgi:hypothetical protein